MKNPDLCFLANSSVHLSQTCWVVVTCWFVEAHAKFIPDSQYARVTERERGWRERERVERERERERERVSERERQTDRQREREREREREICWSRCMNKP